MMKILGGSKLWFLQCKFASAVPMVKLPEYQGEWNIGGRTWCAAHLNPGDILYVDMLDVFHEVGWTLFLSERMSHGLS